MEDVFNNVSFWIMFIGFNIMGIYLCISLRVPPEYRTNNKK